MSSFQKILLFIVTLISIVSVVGSCFKKEESRPVSNQYENLINLHTKDVKEIKKSIPKPILKSTSGPSAKVAKKQFKFQKKNRSKKKKVSSLMKNMHKLGLDGDIFKYWFKKGVPGAVHYWEDGELIIIEGNDGSKSGSGSGNGKGIDKTLYLSDDLSIQEIIRERNRKSESFEDFYESKRNKANLMRHNHDDYEVVSFFPGVRDNRKEFMKRPLDINFSVTGPDHTFDSIDMNDPNRREKLTQLREKTVSLGHGGEIILKITKGLLRNQKGFDFIIYENPFRVKDEYLGSLGIPLIYQEFARVGVSQTRDPKSFKWFSCDPKKGNLSGCAGVVPTDEGGDKFDLSLLGLSWIKFIKIRDTGNNFNNSGEDTEGFDLDALKLINP